MRIEYLDPKDDIDVYLEISSYFTIKHDIPGHRNDFIKYEDLLSVKVIRSVKDYISRIMESCPLERIAMADTLVGIDIMKWSNLANIITFDKSGEKLCDIISPPLSYGGINTSLEKLPVDNCLIMFETTKRDIDGTPITIYLMPGEKASEVMDELEEIMETLGYILYSHNDEKGILLTHNKERFITNTEKKIVERYLNKKGFKYFSLNYLECVGNRRKNEDN